MKHFKNNVLFLFLACTAVFLLSCAADEAGSTADAEQSAFQKKNKGPLEVEAWLSTVSISLADTVDMTLKLKIEKAYTPEIKADVFLNNPFFVLRDVDEDVHSDAEYLYYYVVYNFEPHFSGKLEIPSLFIEFKKKDEKQNYSLNLDPFTVEVTGLTEQEKKNLQIRDIAGPRELAIDPIPLWVFIVSGSTVLLITVLTLYLLKRKKEIREQLVPPYERALAKLRILGEQKYIEEGKFEDFYYEITMIIRVFISEQFSIDAPESTTEEFLSDMEQNPGFPSEYKPKFKEYLNHCDMVKYAAVIPGTEEIQNIFNITRDFILSAGKPDQS